LVKKEVYKKMKIKIEYPFDLDVKQDFLCPHCKKQKEWYEIMCDSCGYDEYDETIDIDDEKKERIKSS
jgi:hypothetical protein